MSRYDDDGLTIRERDIYEFIKEYQRNYGYSPTITETANALYTSRTFIRTALYNLERKGFIRYDSEKHRTIILIKTRTA